VINKSRIKWLFLLSLVVLLSSLVAPFALLSQTASAYTIQSDLSTSDTCKAAGGVWRNDNTQVWCEIGSTPAQEANLLLSAAWLADCISQLGSNLSLADIANYQIHTTNNKTPIIGRSIDNPDGAMECNNPANIKTRVAILGYADFSSYLKAAGSKAAPGGGLTTNLGTGSDVYSKTVTANFGPGSATVTQADKYYIALTTFTGACEATLITSPTADQKTAAKDINANIYLVTAVAADGTITDTYYTATRDKGTIIPTINAAAGWSSNGNFSCGSLANMTATYAPFYRAWAKNNPVLAANVAAAQVSSAAAVKGTSSCTVDGIGWIVCPVVNFMAHTADSAFGFLADNFLATSPKIFDSANPTFNAWSAMRNLANVAFVIAFLIIIFSQLTSVGITNYGVKKMLPRLVIAAILVNISYFICQIAVDLSNILGYSLKDLFAGLAATATGTPQTTVSSFANGTGFAGVAGGILGFAGGIAIAYALLAALIPVVLAALVALVMILFVLVARQALIILLVVISPLAFVAYLLPNTEQWFKKWQKTFTAMLMLFPIIALVFGMSSLAAEILSKNADFGTSFTANTEANKMFAQVVAAAVMVLPLFVVPGLLKKALDGVGGIGAKINGIGGKLGGALGAKGKESYSQSAIARGRELKKQGKQEFRNRQFNDAMAGGEGAAQRVRRALGRGGRPLSERGVFARNRATQAAAGASASAENKDYNEAVAAAAAQQRNSTVAEVANMAATGMHNGQVITEHERAAAIDRTMSSGGFSQRRAVLEGLASDKAGTSRDLRSRAITGAYSKGDQNIFGVAFGDQILDEGGTINGAGDLAAAVVQNAADGHVQAEHLVQGSSATEYLVNSTLASADPYARNNLRDAAATLRATPSLQGKSDGVIDASLATL